MMSLKKKRLNIIRIGIILNTRYKRGIFLNLIQWIFSGIYYMINLIGNSLIRHIRYYREFNCSNFSKFSLKSGNIVCGERSITWLVECSLYLPQLRRLCVLGLFGFQWWWQRMVVYSFASVDRQPNKQTDSLSNVAFVRCFRQWWSTAERLCRWSCWPTLQSGANCQLANSTI